MGVSTFMRSGSVDEIKYPLIQETDTRVQIIYGPATYGLLLKCERADSWCGYTPLTQQEAEHTESWKQLLGASYLAPASSPITWMLPDRARNLTQVAQLLDAPGGDFWLGFHLPPGVSKDKAARKLAEFTLLFKKVLLTHANPLV